jgi:asparagine synthase (glutamine-hydrolysing)
VQTLWDVRRESAQDGFGMVRLFECRHQLPNCYNMKVDKASMSVSVEARVPFLDDRVAREALALPQALLLREGTNKHLLRRMAERHSLLPKAILERPKYGASIAATWIDAVPGFRQFARDVVLDPAGWAGPLGLRAAMEDYFLRDRQGYRFPRGIGIFSIVAWRLLMLNLWSRRYLAPRSMAA